jgi:tRNA modification GTPase
VEVRLNLGGYLLQVADTAGMRQTAEPIEAEGVRRALAHATGGMTLLLLDGSLENPCAGLPADLPEPDLIVWNKSDLSFARDGLSISLKTGEGISELLKMLQQKVQQKLESGDGAPPLTRPRHRHALHEAAAALQHGLDAPQGQPELLAEDLRLAMRAVGRITGRVDVEELLDFVFRDFCIGK